MSKLICACILIFANVRLAKAQTDSAEKEYKIYINAGAFFPEVETRIQADGEHGLGTVIFVENFLNADKNPFVFTANGYWKITKRSSVNARFFHYTTTGHIETSQSQITIRDSVIQIGAQIDSRLTMNYFGLTYDFSVFAKPTWNAGLSLGLRSSFFDFNLDYQTLDHSGNYSENITIPIILWGLFIDGYLTPHLRGTYTFEMFQLTVKDISGLVYENRFGLEYYFLKNIGAGFSYNQISYRINDVPLNKVFNGLISYNLSGLQLNLHARF